MLLDPHGGLMQVLDGLLPIAMPDLRLVDGLAQHFDRFVVHFGRYGKGVSVLSPMREGKASRILEARRRTVKDFADQGEGLQGAGPYSR